jgi:ATP-dependent Clp protease ATP-binding subunit ClpC
MNISPEAKDFIAQKGFDPHYGARPLKRAIQKFIEDSLAEEIISGRISEGDTITVELDGEEIKITKAKIRKKKNS